MRYTNPELAQLLKEARGVAFDGDAGIARLSALVSARLGVTISPPSIRSYFNGHRTPALPTLYAMCVELGINDETRARAAELVGAHYLRRRGAIASADPVQNEITDGRAA